MSHTPTDNKARHEDLVADLVKQLPQTLTIDDVGIGELLHNIRSAINRIQKQEWLIAAHQWLQEKADPNLVFKAETDDSNGNTSPIYVPSEGIDGIEDVEAMEEEIQQFTTRLNDIDIDDTEWISKTVERLNKVNWSPRKAVIVLGERAEEMGIREGRSWLEGIAAERQRRSMEEQTAHIETKLTTKSPRL